MISTMFGAHLLIDYDHGCSGEFLTKEIARFLGFDIPFYTLNGRTKVQDVFGQILLNDKIDESQLLDYYQKLKSQNVVSPTHRRSNIYHDLTKHHNLKVIRIGSPYKYQEHVISCIKKKVWYSPIRSAQELKGFMNILNLDIRKLGSLTHKNNAIELYQQKYPGLNIEEIEQKLTQEMLYCFNTPYSIEPEINSVTVDYDNLMFDDTENSVKLISDFLNCDMTALFDIIKQHVRIDRQ